MEAFLTLLFNTLLLVFMVKLFLALFHTKLIVILFYLGALLFAMALSGRFPETSWRSDERGGPNPSRSRLSWENQALSFFIPTKGKSPFLLTVCRPTAGPSFQILEVVAGKVGWDLVYRWSCGQRSIQTVVFCLMHSCCDCDKGRRAVPCRCYLGGRGRWTLQFQYVSVNKHHQMCGLTLTKRGAISHRDSRSSCPSQARQSARSSSQSLFVSVRFTSVCIGWLQKQFVLQQYHLFL